MGRYARKREESRELAAAKRRRKTALGESEIPTSPAPIETHRSASSAPANSGDSSSESVNTSCSGLASCCSSIRLSELTEERPEIADLEENAVVVEYFATSDGHPADSRDWRENSLSSEIETESGELEWTAEPPPASGSRSIPTAEKMPTEAELEEFFAAAEENIQKQFIEKYNYDIVKDEPLEGRYEWVPVEVKS